MHHTQKKKYLSMKDAGMTPDELITEMRANGVSETDIHNFIGDLEAETKIDEAKEAVIEDAKALEQPITIEAESATAANKFNAKDLRGANFTKYEEHLASLPLFKLLDFQVFKVKPLITERYPGLKGSPRDLTGVEVVNDTPIHTTRIAPKTAIEMNSQVRNTGRYYVLK